MDTKDILTKYAYYYEYLKRLGNYTPDSDVTIENLRLSRGAIQAAYKEIKEYEFKDTIIDYLCWISTLHVLNIAHHNIKNRNSSRKYAEYIIEEFDPLKSDVLNLLRLFHRKPEYFFDWIYSQDTEGKIIHVGAVDDQSGQGDLRFKIEYYDDVNTYTLLSSFRFLIYRKKLYNLPYHHNFDYPLKYDLAQAYIGVCKPIEGNEINMIKRD